MYRRLPARLGGESLPTVAGESRACAVYRLCVPSLDTLRRFGLAIRRYTKMVHPGGPETCGNLRVTGRLFFARKPDNPRHLGTRSTTISKPGETSYFIDNDRLKLPFDGDKLLSITAVTVL